MNVESSVPNWLGRKIFAETLSFCKIVVSMKRPEWNWMSYLRQDGPPLSLSLISQVNEVGDSPAEEQSSRPYI